MVASEQVEKRWREVGTLESVKGPTSHSGTNGRAVWVVSHLLWDLYSLRSERRQPFGLLDDVTHSWGQVSMTV